MITENFDAIISIAKKRWLKTNEINYLLTNPPPSSLILSKIPYLPKSGDLFILKLDPSNKKWKNDGHAYLPRKNGVGFREDIEYLKIGGQKEIVCYYSHIVKPCFTNEQTQIILSRRIYKLTKNETSNQLIVHYFSNEEIIRKENIEENSKYNFSEMFASKTTSLSLGEKNLDRNVDFLEVYPEQNEEIISNTIDDFFDNNFLSNDDYIFKGCMSPVRMVDNNFNINETHRSNHSTNQDPLQCDILQKKILELEAKIQNLELEKQIITKTPSISTHSNSCDSTMKINDFSPEWDFESGGAKFMLCFSPNIPITEEIFIYFGEIKVPAKFIQPGVLKCQVPSHDAGTVILKLFINGAFIEDTNLFEYKDKKKRNKKKEKIGELLFDKSDAKKMNQNFKVRIVEKLSSLCSDNKNPGGKMTPERANNLKEAFEDENIEKILEIYRQEPDTFDSAAFINVLNLISKGKYSLEDSLNELDEDGFALIHYISLMNFYEAISVLAKFKADLNLPSKTGITPLQIAIAFNYEQAVEIFIKNGVINSENISDLITENHKSSKPSNMDILFKNSHILDMLLREVTLHDSINNSSSVHTDKFSWNQQDDQEEENFIDFMEIINEMEKMDIHSEDDEKPNKANRAENYEAEFKKKEMKKHKYLKTWNKKKFEGKTGVQINEENEKYKEIYDLHQERIKIIQKNVRGWLLRRQYLDIKYAARVLQNYIRGKFAKKQISPEYKLLIKNKLKDWLNIKS